MPDVPDTPEPFRSPEPFLSPEEVRAWHPERWARRSGDALAQARGQMVDTGQWNGGQCMGRRWPIGYVALEVTQRCERKGFSSEFELNKVRREYIERTCGLGLSVMFNTTVFPGNAHGVPMLAAFFVANSTWQMRRDLITARGRVSKVSFFIHNFMDACRLERERVAACAFKVATADGPVSMCLHNARRDDFLLQPLAIQMGPQPAFWNPVTGRLQSDRRPSCQQSCAKGAARRASEAMRRSLSVSSPDAMDAYTSHGD